MHLFLPCLLSLTALSTPLIANEVKESRNPTGTWCWERNIGGNVIESRLRLQLDGKSISGTYDNQNVDVEIEQGTFDGKEFNIHFDVDFDGNTIRLEFNGKVDDDKLVGTIGVNNGEEFPWEARRATEPADVRGIWKLEVQTPDGQLHLPSVHIQHRRNRFSGSYVSELVGELALTDISLKQNELRFTARNAADPPVILKYVGKPHGSTMNGELTYSLGDQKGTLKFRGQRSIKQKPALRKTGKQD